MGRNSLLGHVAFGAFAGLAVIPWVLVAAPLLGSLGATAAFAVGALVLYVAWIAPEPSRALAAGALAAISGSFFLLAGAAIDSPSLVLFATAVVLGVVRSGLLYRRAPLRALFVEFVLLIGGLAFAWLLADGSLLGLGLAIWGFFLVQSLFPLLGGLAERSHDRPQEDPFDEARRRALALMEEGI